MSALKIRNEGDEVEIDADQVSVLIRFRNQRPGRVLSKVLTPQAPKKGTGGKAPVVVGAENVPRGVVGEEQPLAAPAAKEIREHRPGTKRAKVVTMLRKGTTIQRIMKEMSWNRSDARAAVRQIHRELGYGIDEGKGGKLALLEPDR